MLIQEVILENFMSYEYARVPFELGVNVICGPNGSGKSSLLLAVSVALGQSYTERSKKLSEGQTKLINTHPFNSVILGKAIVEVEKEIVP